MLETGKRKGPASAADVSVPPSAATSGGQDVRLDSAAATYLNLALITASIGGDLEAVRVLLSQGAQVSACDDSGRTGLHRAAAGGHVEVVKLLIAHGADTRALSRLPEWATWTPLSRACYHGHLDVIRAILSGRKGQSLPRDAEEVDLACWHAIHHENREVLEVLLTEGANFFTRTKHKISLIWFAAGKGKTAYVETLLRHSVDPSFPDDHGVTPLMLAAKIGQLDIVKLLLAYGAGVNAKDNKGRRAVAYASRNGHKDVVRALVSHQAALTSNPPTAHVDQVPVQRASSMDGAAGGAPDDLTPRNVDTALLMLVAAARAGDEEKVDEVLKSSPELDVNALHKGKGALMHAVNAGHVGVVGKLLAEHRADPNLVWTEGTRCTCLMLAAHIGNEELVRLLLAHGANVHAKDAYGWTAVHHALGSPDVADVRILQLLEAHGADLTGTDSKGATALMVAAHKANMGIIRYLLANGADPSAKDELGRDAMAYTRNTSQGREVVAVLTEAVKAHMERLAAQIEGQVKGEAPMHKDKKRSKKHRQKNGKGEGAATVCEGDAQAGGGLAGIDVNGGAVGEEQQVEQATALVALASLHEGEVELAAEEAKAQQSATAVAVPADAGGVQNEKELPPVELSEEDLDDAPTLFECPISHTIMRDPVAACDGYSYERSRIETWIRKAAEDNVALRSPMTNEAMEAGLNRNLVLKFLVDEYVQRKLTEKRTRPAAVAAHV